MRTRLAVLGLLSLSLAVVDSTTRVGLAQGIATRAGQAIDGVGRGIKQEAQNVGSALRRRSRLRAPKSIGWGSPPACTATPLGQVPDPRAHRGPSRSGGRSLAARDRPRRRVEDLALALASETVDVTSVIDELTVLTTATAIKP